MKDVYTFRPHPKGVTVRKNGKSAYLVYCNEGGVPTFCTCPKFKFQRRPVSGRTPCHHMAAVHALVSRAA